MSTDELNEKCFNAARHGDIDQLKQSIADGADINAKVPPSYYTPISMAAAKNQPDAVRCLVESGADVHGGALLQACNFGHCDVLNVLLEAGGNANYVKDDTGETPLHIATCRGHRDGTTECVRRLLAAGADPNAPAKNRVGTPTWGGAYVVGETPLHLAAAYGDVEMIQLLIDAGADTELKDADGHMPRFYFARYSSAKDRGKIKELLPYHEPQCDDTQQ